MLERDVLNGIACGRITLQFRPWKRPTVRAGGTLLTAIEQLGIDAVDPLEEPNDLTEADARAAGFSNRATLESVLG